MKKQGALFDILVWLIIIFIAIIFLGVWLYGHNLLTNALISAGSTDTKVVNITYAATSTFGQINTTETKWFGIIAFIIIFGQGLSILVTSFYVKEHPIMFIPYALITAVAIIVSVYISNAYEGLMTGATLGTTLTSNFVASNFIFLHLPLWTSVIGIFGLILLLSGILIDKDLGGGMV